MKTTVDIPDDVYRQAKAKAALSGRKFKDLVEEGLRLVLDGEPAKVRRRSLSAKMKNARGMIDSGVSDFGSNPKHLRGFGRDARHR